MMRVILTLVFLASICCVHVSADSPRLGDRVPRAGDEIIVCGELVHTTAPVVTWLDPGGYDAYRVERRFSPFDRSDWQVFAKELETPNRYGFRSSRLTAEEIERLRGGGWDLPTLQKVVDQFVLHYDVCGTSRRCFQVLHDARGLSVHFMLDIDGTIYQTLDVKERAWHATTSNSRSIGIEIAQIGAYPAAGRATLDQWYQKDETGVQRIVLPASMGDGGVRTSGFIGRPARPDLVTGTIQGVELLQYDFTPEQYDSLVKLTATLCSVFPQIHCDYPRDEQGRLIPHKLPDERLEAYQGILGHYHVQTNKSDPGPALQWDYLIDQARRLMTRKQE